MRLAGLFTPHWPQLRSIQFHEAGSYYGSALTGSKKGSFSSEKGPPGSFSRASRDIQGWAFRHIVSGSTIREVRINSDLKKSELVLLPIDILQLML